MCRFALASAVLVLSLSSIAGCALSAPELEPEQRRLRGGDPAPKPASAPSPEASVACCAGADRFECPDETACHEGFDERACFAACSDAACLLDCTSEAARHPPSSACTKVGACR